MAWPRTGLSSRPAQAWQLKDHECTPPSPPLGARLVLGVFGPHPHGTERPGRATHPGAHSRCGDGKLATPLAAVALDPWPTCRRSSVPVTGGLGCRVANPFPLTHPPGRQGLAQPHHPLPHPLSPPDARFDDPKLGQGSCEECRRVQAAAQVAAINASAAHCEPDVGAALEFRCESSAPSIQRTGMGSAALLGASLAPFVAATAAGAFAATAAAAGGGGAIPSTLPTCAPVLRWRGGSTAARHLSDSRPADEDRCRSHLASLARRSFGVRMPRDEDVEAVRLRGLTPSVALVYGLVPCLGKAVAGEEAAAQRQRLGPASVAVLGQASDSFPPQQRHSQGNKHLLLGGARSFSPTNEDAGR